MENYKIAQELKIERRKASQIQINNTSVKRSKMYLVSKDDYSMTFTVCGKHLKS